MVESDAWKEMTRDRWTDAEIRGELLRMAKFGGLERGVESALDELLRRAAAVSELRLVEVWYVETVDYVEDRSVVLGTFRTEDEARRFSNRNTGARYVRQGWLATADGVTGYLTASEQLTATVSLDEPGAAG